jgi:RNA polymerase sigma factor (sigma-70 family)
MNTQTGKEQFSNLMQEHRGILFKVCHSYCRNKADIDDLAQEMIYQLWKSFDNYDPRYKFTTWMYRVVLNVAISFYRKEKKSRGIMALDEHVIEIADNSYSHNDTEKELHHLRQFIGELKELDKALIILYLEEKSYREISEIMGITETNTSTRISRIKEQLKQKFSNLQES